MLSILIPTYNYDTYNLVKTLHEQAIEANIVFEILVYDDASALPNKNNNKISNLSFSKFISLEKNIGRSAIRNLLVNDASYQWLLFMDGDSVIKDNAFISNYIHAIKKNTDVVYGGRKHPKKVESHRKLRWKYGVYVEDLPAASRKMNAYKCVLFNNTLVRKGVFNSIVFEKSITSYGHEDTVFAYQLSKLKASILHIDNPILHGDVDLNDLFLEKTKKSLNNLNSIYKTNLVDTNFVTFLKIFKKLKSLKVNYILSYFYITTAPFYKLQLTSKYPSLFVFNVFRLTYFCNINLKK